VATAEKTAAVAEITESFRGSSAAVLTEYRGLTVSEIGELRRALGTGTRYAVVKNTLTKIAAGEAGVVGLDEMLAGPTAIAFVTGDPVEAAKGLRDFAKTHPLLVVKGGVLDGRPLSPEEITRLADLESREVLLAKLAGAMKGSLSQAVALFAAPLAQAARALGALEAKAQADPSVLAGGAGTPVEPALTTELEAAEPETAEPETAEPETAEPETAAAEPVDETAAETQPETVEEAQAVVAAAEAPQPDAAPDTTDDTAPDTAVETGSDTASDSASDTTSDTASETAPDQPTA
jgi:large subunit ribosomal protein L10